MSVENKVRGFVEARIKMLDRIYSKYTILQRILNLDSSICYSIFGFSNRYPENLDDLQLMLINGLYDDSQLGVVNDKIRGPIVTHVSDEHTNIIYEDDLNKIIDAFEKAHRYHGENLPKERSLSSEEYRKFSIEYRRLSNEATTLLKSYGDDNE